MERERELRDWTFHLHRTLQRERKTKCRRVQTQTQTQAQTPDERIAWERRKSFFLLLFFGKAEAKAKAKAKGLKGKEVKRKKGRKWKD